jgi:hypothetical protein
MPTEAAIDERKIAFFNATFHQARASKKYNN